MQSTRFCPQCRAEVTLHHPTKGRNLKCTFCFEETDEGMTWYACTSRTERHYMCSPCLERSIRATNNDTRRITKDGDTAGMCPKCYYGPLDVYNNCGDLRAHHLDRVRDCYGPRGRRDVTSNDPVYSGWVLNSCPQCCFYSTKPEDWVPWDCMARTSKVDVRITLVHVKFGSREYEEGSEPHQYLQEYLFDTPVHRDEPRFHSGLFSSFIAQLPGVTPHCLANIRETIRNVNSADQSAGRGLRHRFEDIERDHIFHSYTRHIVRPLLPHRAEIFRIMIATREYDEIDVAWVLHADRADTIDEARASLLRRRSVPLPPPPPSRSLLIRQHEGTHLRRNLIQAKCYFF
eukprot:PhF_6_TR13461/c1_g2_i5/m.21583